MEQQKRKRKILMLSDHPLCTSGVGVQSRFLIEGLVKTGKYSFKCLGGAMKHPSYETVTVNPDFIIKPVDGFGTRESIRQIITTERPDALLLFTDPRQFVWLWEMSDEIHQVCPISYWHVWDNDPYPAFNKVWYDSTDLINCLSHKTYELVQPHFPEKTNYIPHAFPPSVYHPLTPEIVSQVRKQNFGDREDWFIGLWVNRNATRKMPADVLGAWKLFLDKLEKEEGHKRALLIMHTDPTDQEGPNLFAVSELLGLSNNVWFSTQKLEFGDMNVLHNISDFTVNISKAEGFGLSCLSSLQVGKPVVALKTGGMIRQATDYRDGFELGAAIDPTVRVMAGSQLVPYIYDDHVSTMAVAAGFMKVYKLTPAERLVMSQRTQDYVNHEFNFEKMISDWDQSLDKCITEWKSKKPRQWELIPLQSKAVQLATPPRDVRQVGNTAPIDLPGTNAPTPAPIQTEPLDINKIKVSYRQPKPVTRKVSP